MATNFTSISVSDTTSTNNLNANSISTNAITLNSTDLYVGSAIHCDNLTNNTGNILIASPTITIGNALAQNIDIEGSVVANVNISTDNTGLIFNGGNKIYKKTGEGISIDTSSLRVRDLTGAFTSLTINQPTTAITGTTVLPTGNICVNKTTATSGYMLDVNGGIINNNILRTTATTVSTSTSTGALQVAGGVGIGGATYIGGVTNITNTTNASSTSTGALIVSGGVGIAQNLVVGGATNLNGVTTVNNVLGVNGTISTSDATASTSTNTGALKVTGGVGVGGNVNIGGGCNVAGAFSAGSISLTNPTVGWITVNPTLGQPSLNTDIGFFSRVTNSVTVTAVAGRTVRDVITLTTLPAGVWRFDVTFSYSFGAGILNTSNSVVCAVSKTSLYDPYTDTNQERSGGRAFWDRDGGTAFFWGGTYSFSVIDSSATASNWYITATGGNTTTASGNYTYKVQCTFSRVA